MATITLDKYFTTGLRGAIVYDDGIGHSPLAVPATLSFIITYDREDGERSTPNRPGCAEEIHVRDVGCYAIFIDNDRMPTPQESREIGDWFRRELNGRPGLLESMRPVSRRQFVCQILVDVNHGYQQATVFGRATYLSLDGEVIFNSVDWRSLQYPDLKITAGNAVEIMSACREREIEMYAEEA